MTKEIQWVVADGACGHNLGDLPVEAAYVNGVALFAYESPLSKAEAPFYSCTVTGQMTCGGISMNEAKAAGVQQALMYGVSGSDRRLSRKQFDELVASSERLENFNKPQGASLGM